MSKGATRRAELLAVAAEVFAERGYQGTTVREVADAAGLLAGSLYYHFDSKESIVDEILSSFLTDLWSAYDRVLEAGLGPRTTFEALVVESFRAIEAHRFAVAIYQQEAKQLAHAQRFGYLRDSRARFETMWTGVLDDGVGGGEFRKDLDTRLVYRFIRDTVWVAVGWYRPGGPLSADAIAEQYLSMVLDGIAVPDDRTKET